MADLTQRLPLTQGTNRVIDDPATPSFVGAALDFATQALQGYSKLKGDLANQKASARAAEEKAAQAQIAFEVTGAHDAARREVVTSSAQQIQASTPVEPVQTPGESGIFSQLPADVSPVMEREVMRSAGQAKNVVTAVEQGKMPEISMNAALNSRFMALREKYPEHTEYILDMWKKTGLDANLFTEGKDAQDWHNANREAAQASVDDARKREESYIATAEQILGPEALGKTREELIGYGLTATKDSYDLDMAKERLDVQLKRADLSAKGREEVESNHNQVIEQKFNNAIYNQAVPVISTISNLATSLMRDPGNAENIQAFQEHGVRVRQMIPMIAENALQTAVANGYTGDPEKFKQRIIGIYGPLTDLFTGEHSVVAASVDALRAIETAGKTETAQALPIMTTLQRMGVKTAEMPAMMQAIEQNPQLQERFKNEINGFITDMDADRASTRLMDVIKILRGEESLSQMSPERMRQNIGGLTSSTRALALDYNRGKDVDGEKVINGVGEITVAARVVSPSSGYNVIYVATKGFADANVRSALIKAVKDPAVEDKTMALATAQASRAASAHMLNNIRLSVGRANEASGDYFKIKYDSKNGRYFIDNSGQKRAVAGLRAGAGSSSRGMSGEDAKFGRLADTVVNADTIASLSPPEGLTRLVEAGNINLDNAIEIGAVDPSTPKANEIQLRNWYAQNTPLPSEGGGKNINPTKEVGKQLDILDDMLTETFEDVLKPIKLPSTVTKSEYYSQNAPSVAAAAAKYGVPEQLAEGLIGKESSFNPDAAGPVIKSGSHKGDRAMGLGQVMAKTAAAYGVTDRASLSPAEQADLSMRILADNYKQTGNWRDAVSMYFTGTTYAKAVAQGRSDGLTSVLQYVKDVM